MAAVFYLEAIATEDVDVFVIFEPAPLLLTLTPIYEFLQQRGHQPRGEAISVYDWPVQFLAAEAGLLREAVEQARSIDYQGTPARVMTPEHLMAIALQTGRPKDDLRLLAFLKTDVANFPIFEQIVSSFNLQTRWNKFRQKFPHMP
jgi:hypothetical protein